MVPLYCGATAAPVKSASAGKGRATARVAPAMAREEITSAYCFPQPNFHSVSPMLRARIGAQSAGLASE
jgi:hypothetical protein